MCRRAAKRNGGAASRGCIIQIRSYWKQCTSALGRAIPIVTWEVVGTQVKEGVGSGIGNRGMRTWMFYRLIAKWLQDFHAVLEPDGSSTTWEAVPLRLVQPVSKIMRLGTWRFSSIGCHRDCENRVACYAVTQRKNIKTGRPDNEDI
jgi:hypothetical protein